MGVAWGPDVLLGRPVLTAQHHPARFEFAREHQNWQVRHWHPVLFTDESKFTISTCEKVWRRRGERYAACNIIQHDRFSGGSVMVWGSISLDGRTNLHVPGWSPIVRTFPRPESDREPLGCYVSVMYLPPPSCATDCPGAHWCPDPGLRRGPPRTPSSVSSGAFPDVVGSAYRHVGSIETLLSHILSCCDEIKLDQPAIIICHFDFRCDVDPSRG